MKIRSVFIIISISFVISCKNDGKLGLADANQQHGGVFYRRGALLAPSL